MRLHCEIQISDRNLPSLCSRPNQKPSRASLMMGFPPGMIKSPDNLHLLLCSSRQQAGTKYKVHGNAVKVFEKYVDQGKATIRLEAPPHDLLIRNADPLELRSFLKAMHSSITATASLEHSSLPRLLVNRIRIPKTKLEIVDLQTFSKVSTFPSTLRVLKVQNCRLRRIDSRVMILPRLEVLDFCNNAIVDIPVKMATTHIKELNLSNNCLSVVPKGVFDNSSLCQTLQTLILSHNELPAIPSTIGNLVLLHTFNLSHNKLTHLPDSLCDLQRLKNLIIDNNFLSFLPGRIIRMKLDYLDVSTNPFKGSDNSQNTDGDPCASLLEWAARSFLKSGMLVPDAELPLPVRDYLTMAKKCLCNRPFVISHVKYASIINLKTISQNVAYSFDSQVLVSGMACSQACVSYIQN